MIKLEDFTPDLVGKLAQLKAAGMSHASWTCVYDGDELEACDVDLQKDGKAADWHHFLDTCDVDIDEVLLALAGGRHGDNGKYILNLETGNLYQTHEAWREMKLVERPLRRVLDLELTSLNLDRVGLEG